jgi:YD repeat-containing protein
MKQIIFIIGFILLGNSLFAQTPINYSYDNLNRLTKAIYPDSSIITYTYDNNGNRVAQRTQDPCATKPRPSIAASGPTLLCAGDSVMLTTATGLKYRWSNGDTIHQSITVHAAGEYSVTRLDTFRINSDTIQCLLTSDTIHVTVSALPYVAAISGPSGTNVYSSITLTDSVAGGVWTSSNPGVATVTSTGTVIGLEIGTANITYTVAYSCAMIDTFKSVMVTASASPNIYTIAGNSSYSYSAYDGDGGPATAAHLNQSYGVVTDKAGNVFIADGNNNCIRKINTSGIISTHAAVGRPTALAIDKKDNLYVISGNVIQEINTSGSIFTIAGNGIYHGYYGDGGPATSASLWGPSGVAVDKDGSVYIAEHDGQIVRKVDTFGMINTIAGTFLGGGGTYFTGSGGPATSAHFYLPKTIAVDTNLNVYVSDETNQVHKIDTNHIITTIAGTGNTGFSGDGGPATAADINNISAIAVDMSGNIFIADNDNYRIREVHTSGIISTIGGNGSPGYSGDGGPAISANIDGFSTIWGGVSSPIGIWADNYGNVYFTDNYNYVRMIGVLDYAPWFTGGTTQNLNICSSGSASINAICAINDLDAGQLETVTVITAPLHGTLAGLDASFTSTGNTRMPTGATYTAAAGYNGTDSFSIQVSDGIKTATTKIFVTINSTPTIALGDISPVCSGNTTALLPYTSTTGAPVSYNIAWSSVALAQGFLNTDTSANIITTIAGNGTAGFSGDGGPASASQLNIPYSMGVDRAGNMYVADANNNRIRKVSATGIISTIAGSGTAGYNGDGIAATSAQLNDPQSLKIDAAGNIFFADAGNHRVRYIDTAGVIHTFAGNGNIGAGHPAEGIPAGTSNLYYPSDIAFDNSGNTFIVDGGHNLIRKVNSLGIISAFAGNGDPAYIVYGDGYPATDNSITWPAGIATDTAGNVYFSDNFSAIRKVNRSGIISTVAGYNVAGYSGDGGPATTSLLFEPEGLSIDAAGNIYVADLHNNRIRKISTSGIITTFAGGGSATNYGDNGPATNATLNSPTDVFVDSAGTIYIADQVNNRIRKVSRMNNSLTTSPISFPIPNTAPPNSYTGTITVSNGGCTSTAYPISVTINAIPSAGIISGLSTVCSGTAITLSDTTAGGTWSSSDPSVATVAGGVVTGGSAGVATISYSNTNSCGMAVATALVHVNAAPSISLGIVPSLCLGNTVLSIPYTGVSGSLGYSLVWDSAAIAQGFSNIGGSADRVITTLAGDGTDGHSGDGGDGPSAQLSYRMDGIAVDRSGNVYLADDAYIRKIEPSGIITTIAGNGTLGFGGDGGPATAASFNMVSGLAVDSEGNVYAADYFNDRIRKISISGIITTIAGITPPISLGDGAPATAAYFESPVGVAVDRFGSIYITTSSHCIKKVNPSGIITTIAGNCNNSGYSGDGGSALSALLSNPTGIAVDAYGNIFFTAQYSAIRKIDTSGIISTIAGNHIYGTYTGDNGPATNAGLYYPWGISVDRSGNIYFADKFNQVIRKIDPWGIITTITGNGFIGGGIYGGYSGDGGDPNAAELNNPHGLALDNAGNLFIADVGNRRIRKVSSAYNSLPTSLISLPAPGNAAAGTYNGTITVFNGTCPSSSYPFTATINPTPTFITGQSGVCAGSSITLTHTPFTGGSWSNSVSSVATVTNGVVTGIGPGVDTIFYSYPTPCGVAKAQKVITVHPLPSAISGSPTICSGSATTLSDTASGGTWSSSNTSIVMVDNYGMVHGISSGITDIVYVLPTGCSATKTLTVNPLPTAITGIRTACAGAATSLGNITVPGVWSSGNSLVATVDAANGVVSGASAGITNITYTLPTGCMVSAPITIRPLPAAITGITAVCQGYITHLSDATSGAVWSSGDTSIATVDATGTVTGIATGSSVITYTLPTGCATTTTITVNPLPAAISGSSTVCANFTTTLSDTTSSGRWSSTTLDVAIIDAISGVVSGISAGSSLITYALPTGCATLTTISVLPLPSPISGPDSVCENSTISLSDTSSGGIWSSGNSLAHVDIMGIVTGMSNGLSAITYTLPSGCFVSKTVTVNALPPAITGITHVCAGAATTLTDIGEGTWSSSNIVSATVDPSGVVSGTNPGNTIVAYILPTGCAATIIVTVDPLPAAINGVANVCAGSTTTLNDITPLGTWSSGTPGIAIADTSSGAVTGIGPGTSLITYTLPTGCTATKTVTVLPLPVPISGSSHVCEGSVISLVDTTSYGIWSSSNTTFATIDTGGFVSGIAAGNVIITYTLPSGCLTSKVIQVDPLPSVITGPAFVCTGSTTTLNDIGGGTWSSSNTVVATVNISGMVYGISPGTLAITYTLPTSCATIKTVTVNPLPSPIIGASNVCRGLTISLSDTTTGGTWSTGDPTIATIASATGITTGVSAGTALITFTLPTGCTAVKAITVNPIPDVIIPSDYAVCNGLTADSFVFSGSVSRTSYSWTNNNTGIGLASSGSGNISSFVATNTTSLPISATITVLPFSGYCVGISDNFTITIKPTPALTTTATSPRICDSTSFIYAATSPTPGTIFNWSRPSIAGITPSAGSGTDQINERLVNSTALPINVAYIFSLNAAGCTSTGNENVIVEPRPPEPPAITTKSPSYLCSGTMYQNFGASMAPPAGVRYLWSATGAEVWATGSDKQYTLVNFPTAGLTWVILSATYDGYVCSSKDSFAVLVDGAVSNTPGVTYSYPSFVCTSSPEYTYQWGYDNASTLDSSLLTGETNQSYFNNVPNYINKYYWVITTYDNCMQKTYYAAPAAIHNLSKGGLKEVSISPNPNTGTFEVDVVSDITESGSIIVTNMLGQKMMQTEFLTNKKADVSISCQPGVYIVSVITPHGQYTRNMVIVR